MSFDSNRELRPIATRIRAALKWYNPTKGFGFVTPDDGSADAFLHVSVVEQAGLRTVDEGAILVCDIVEGRRGAQVSIIHNVEEGAAPARRGNRPEPGTRYPRHNTGGYDDYGYGSPSRGGYGDQSDSGYGVQPRYGYGDQPSGGYGDQPSGGYGARSRSSYGTQPGSGSGTPAAGRGSMEGAVKWFNPDKGFGFIVPDQGGKDVFVHISAINRAGLETLRENQRVRFTEKSGPKGTEADDIAVI